MTELSELSPTVLDETFEAHKVLFGDDWLTRVIEQLDQSSIATFEGVTAKAGLLRIASQLHGSDGEIRRHCQTDAEGITTMLAADHHEIEAKTGVVYTPHWEVQELHTDGTSGPVALDPPGVVILVNHTSDPNVPRINVFSSAAGLYRALGEENPELLDSLKQPIDFGSGVRKPVFEQQPSGRWHFRMRQSPHPPYMGLSSEVRDALKSRMSQADLLSGVVLKPGQGVIFDNAAVAHGLAPSAERGSGRETWRVQLTIGKDSALKPGFRLD